MNQTKNTAVAKPETASQSGRVIGYRIDPVTLELCEDTIIIEGRTA